MDRDRDAGPIDAIVDSDARAGPRDAIHDGGGTRAGSRSTRADRALLAALGVLAWLGVAQVAYLTFIELNGVIVRSQELDARLEVVASLEREAELLRAIVENGDDPAYREALARRLGFMFPTETRVVVMSPR